MNIKFYFYNFFFFRLPLIRNIITLFSDLFNLIVLLLLKKSTIPGEKRLAGRVYCLLHKKSIDALHITKKGIYHERKCISKLTSPVADFISSRGIHIKKKDLSTVHKIIRKSLPGENTDTVASYLKTKWWFIFSLSIYIFVNVFVLVQIAGSYNRYYLIVRGAQFVSDVIWYITNLFFLIQLYIYFKVVIKGVSIKYSFTEADESFEYEYQSRENKPGVIILIPAYKEEPLLLRRILLSQFLQNYSNKKIVVLLDDDKNSDNENDRKNMEATITMIKEFKNDIFLWCKRVEEKGRFFNSDTRDIELIKKNCRGLGELSVMIVNWITQNFKKIHDSKTHYPIDDFFYKEVIKERVHHFNKLKEHFSKMAVEFIQAGEGNENTLCSETFLRRLRNAFNECMRFFNFKLELFIRSDYVNVLPDKTKAANLSTYCRLINKKWTPNNDPDKEKQFISIEGESEEYYPYVAILDADVIAKPNYLLRKIIFLEKKDNQNCGIIQSPYIVPVNEGNRVADATGVHNDWFFPYSLGLNHYNSVFWLGYNGVFRYDILKEKDFFSAKTVVEDIEISLKVRQKNYTLITSPEEQCMTFSPMDMNSLEVQRKRWASGCLRIARIFIKDLLQKKFRSLSFKEFFFRFVYILNLNLLPVFSTLLYFTILSVSKDFAVFLILPWIVYILCLFNLERIKKRRRFSQIVDSIFIYFYMNSFHLKGLIRSIRNLFIKERVFRTTPKKSGYREYRASQKKTRPQLRYFELFEILFITAFYIIMSIENISRGLFYLQIFPIYYIVITYFGIARLVGIKHFFYCLFYRFLLAPIRSIKQLFTGK